MNDYIAVLLLVVLLSAVTGWLAIVGRSAEKPVKVMIFVAYFWLSAFVQLSVLAAAYFIWDHYFSHRL